MLLPSTVKTVRYAVVWSAHVFHHHPFTQNQRHPLAHGSTGAGTTSSGSGSSQSAGSAVPILQSSTSTMATSATPTPNVALEPSIEIVKKTKKHNVANTSVSSARVGYHKRHGTVNPHVEGDISTAII